MQAVILAGGTGTRLAERLHGRPKPLVDIDGIPLLERQIRMLQRFEISDIVVLVSHAADQIERYCAERADFGSLQLRLVSDGEPRGTAGAVLACLDALACRFLVVYGDTLFNIDIRRFIAAHMKAEADATLFLHPNDHPYDSDLVSLNDDDMVEAFHSKPHPPNTFRPNLVNAAFYVIERAALSRWRNLALPCDFGANLFPLMLGAGQRLKGYNSFEYIKDIGTPARLDRAVLHLRSGVVSRATLSEPQPCVFVDRDGTLNVLRDYVRTPEDLELLPGAAEAVRRLNDAEHRIAVVTNQPVIARGECTFGRLRDIHAKLDMELAAAGGFADRIYYCPHHPDSGFPGEVRNLKIRCGCRKPLAGMIHDAARDLHADLDRSWLIGDSTSDLLAARNAGVRSVLVRTGEGGRDGRYPIAPTFEAHDIAEATSFVLDVYPRLREQVSDLVSSLLPGTLLLVGGPARAGKSTLAGVVAHELRQRAVATEVVSLDRWVRPETERRPGVEGRFDLRAVEVELEPWLAGGPAELLLPFYDRTRRRSLDAEYVSLTQNHVLVLEGVPALLLDLETKRSVTRIHVTTDECGRRERTISDLVRRGSANPEVASAVYSGRVADENVVVEEAGSSASLRFNIDNSFSALIRARRP